MSPTSTKSIIASSSRGRRTSNKFSSSNYKITSTKVDSARHTPSIVIELGSAFIKVGIAGEAQPRCILPSSLSPSSLSSFGDTDDSIILETALPSLPYSTMQNTTSSSSFHSYLSPFFHNLYINHLYIKSKSKSVIILLPTYYPEFYKSTIQQILLHELNVPAIKFVNSSSLYTTIPFALGKNIGIVIDVGCMECRIGAYFNRDVIHDTIHDMI